jgi:Zn finger protein HypA/HybF involved in hydrogenase expression
VPRLLFYVVLAVVVVTWIRRFAAKRSDAPSSGGAGVVRGMPRRLVCGACGKEYEPLTNGWLCPSCHK